jgi:hypothetical protein
MKMEFIYMKQPVKVPAYEEILRNAGVSDSAVAFIGDDLPDIPLMRRAGLSIAVGDVGGKEPSLWIIGGQEFDDAEPVLLILPVRLEIVFALRSHDGQSLFPESWLKTRDTQTIHRASVPLYSLLLFTGHYFHDGNTGSNPVGDAKSFQELTSNSSFCRRHKKEHL